MPWGAAAIAGAAVVGSVIAADAAGNAADTQAQASRDASAVQKAMFDKTQENLKPYMDTGLLANNALVNASGLGPNGNPSTSPLLSPIKMDQATLEQTPGYQFNLKQGLKAVQNSAAARGLGVSGAAMKGAAGFATGLADSTYQNQFSNAVTNQTNSFNRLMGLTQLGQNSAANVGTFGTQTGASIGSNIIGAANGQAAAQIAGGNAMAGGVNSIGNMFMLNGILKSQNGTGLFGG